MPNLEQASSRSLECTSTKAWALGRQGPQIGQEVGITNTGTSSVWYQLLNLKYDNFPQGMSNALPELSESVHLMNIYWGPLV